MSNTYTCTMCKGVYEKGWSDKEAKAELDATFAVPESECDLVCDDCYKIIMGESHVQ